MTVTIPHFPFSIADERLSTLSWIEDIFGRREYTMRAIYRDATTQPLAVTPNDPQFATLWHLTGANGINIQPVWDDFRGNGITIGFVDDGMQYTHPDLAGNYNTAIDYDLETDTPDGAPRSASDEHGTTTGGMAAAVGNNGIGVTGVAYEADIANFRLPFGLDLTDSQFATLYQKQLAADVDVSNNSWGFGGFFEDNFNSTMTELGQSLEDLVHYGRDGRGTVLVFASGNGRAEGQNTNYHNLDNSQYVISVAATDQNGKFTSFSTPGASVLVSAPGNNLTSTDRTGADGYVNGDYVTGLAGTSYSAPIVSGIVALMLDANPDLSYRNIQEILAYTSRSSDSAHTGWKVNGATNWNGGGLHFSHDYGFGLVDARAAVRLAEVWNYIRTYDDLDLVNGGTLNANMAIPSNNTTGISTSLNVSSDIDIDRVEVDVNITHPNIGDLIITLVSPTGMTSTLVNRPGMSTGLFGSTGSTQDNINFTLTSNAFWGEQGTGQWTLKVVDARNGSSGTLQDWNLRLYGDTDTADDNYVYTNEYATLYNAARGTLSDSGGYDTLYLAAISSHVTLSLLPGTASLFGSTPFALAAGTMIEAAYLGDGNDSVTGNDTSNDIMGMRGNDSLQGGGGNDALVGGQGEDTAIYEGNFADYFIDILDSVSLSVIDLVLGNGNEGADGLIEIEKLQFADGLYLFNGTSITAPPPNQPPHAANDAGVLNQNGLLTLSVLSNDTDPENDSLIVSGITDTPDHGTVVINANNTVTYTPTAGYFGSDSFVYEINDGQGNADTATVTLSILQANDPAVNLTGNGNANTLTGGNGHDTLNGLGGNDLLTGNGGNDKIDGGNQNDTIYGGFGNDSLLGANNDDVLDGGDGQDTLNGGNNNDTLFGGAGNDSLTGSNGNNVVTGGVGADTISSGTSSADRFIYEQLSDAGDFIQSFRKAQDIIDLRPLMDAIGYAGSNPLADGHLQLTLVAGGDLQLFIDADGIGGSASVLLLTLDNFNSATLALGTDYLV